MAVSSLLEMRGLQKERIGCPLISLAFLRERAKARKIVAEKRNEHVRYFGHAYAVRMHT